MSDYLIQQETMEGIANQVRRISNTSGLYNAAEILEMLSKITGSLDTTVGDIVVEAIDYDGTVLKTATLCEGQVFAMPDPPYHEGLIFQGWTAPTTAINFVTAGAVGFSIGAFYATESGATEYDIVTTEDNQLVNFPEMTGATKIDFGDGSENTNPTTSLSGYTYTTAGNYTMKIYGATKLTGSSSHDYSAITKVRLADSIITLDDYAFYKSGIKNISLSKNIETLGMRIFGNCTSLITIILPPKIKDFNSDYTFKGCTNLTKIILPSNLETFKGYFLLEGCTSLSTIVFPNSIKTIGESIAFVDSDMFFNYEKLTNGTILDNGMYYLPSINNKKHILVGITQDFMTSNNNEIVIPEEVCVLKDSLFANENIYKVTIPDSVKTIPYKLFAQCNFLTDVVLPSEIDKIGYNAFKQTKITSINLPVGLKEIESGAFEYCTKLTDINLPEGLLILGGYVFENCTSLENVTIPSTVKNIGGSLFKGCTALKTVDLSLIVIDDDTSIITSNFFENCSILTDVNLPSGLNEVGDNMFEGCTSLTNIDFLVETITSIEDEAFMNCTGLTEINLPDSVTKLGLSVFGNCTGLTSFNIPANITSIVGNPVSGCTNIESITVDENNSRYIVNNGMLFEKNYTTIIRAMSKDAIIPTDGTIMTLGYGLFYGCDYLTEYEVPNGIKYIDAYCFYGCKNLQSIVFPDTLKTIGIYAFESCSSLTSVTIPKSVTKIDYGAFRQCTGLTSAVYEGTEEEWANVTVGSDNTLLTDIITFTETENN